MNKFIDSNIRTEETCRTREKRAQIERMMGPRKKPRKWAQAQRRPIFNLLCVSFFLSDHHSSKVSILETSFCLKTTKQRQRQQINYLKDKYVFLCNIRVDITRSRNLVEQKKEKERLDN